MTTIDSICYKCNNLSACTNCFCITNGKRSLISDCFFGGKNAGNRKKCAKFEEADECLVAPRLKVLKGE